MKPRSESSDGGKQNGDVKKRNLFRRHNPTIICETQARGTGKLERAGENCSSKEEHKVNALASGAEEGRDNLR